MKSNRIGLLLFILLNLTTFLPNLNAQSKSEPGFIVRLNGDTLLERVETYSFNGNPTTQTLPLFSYPKNTETGWLLGLGIGYDRWALGCRYERTNSVSNNLNVGSVATYYHLMLKVNLF